MITFLSYASKKEENELIKEQIRVQAGRWTEEKWNYELHDQLAVVEQLLASEPLIDMVSWDVTVAGSLKSLESMRSSYKQALLLVIADQKISPMAYLRPGIAPASLLLKPVDPRRLSEVTEELFEVFTERFGSKTIPESFTIETREGKQYIPLDKIYYVEAREKKIFVRTVHEEYGFYETMENMTKQLPPNFLRCHRSYIVNMDKVEMARIARNCLELKGGVTVPLSRNYKKAVKEYRYDGAT